MKKLMIITTLILIGLFSYFKSFAQFHFDVNENTGCSYTIKIYWDDNAGNCLNSTYIWIPGSSSSTYTNPWTPPAGGAVGVEVICNNCGDVATIGNCIYVSCFLPCSWVCCYTHTCGCGSPVNFRFSPYFGTTNAVLDIY